MKPQGDSDRSSWWNWFRCVFILIAALSVAGAARAELNGGFGRVDRGTASADQAEPAPTFLIVIDPGHGGLDPGAVVGSLREKDIVLDVARRLAGVINERAGYRAELTRTRDVTVSLAERVKFATSRGGDAFVSVHASIGGTPTDSGVEAYVLSAVGATDRETQMLADKENAADLVGLVPRHDDGDDVLEILMDLRRNQVLRASARLANLVLGACRRSGLIKARGVKQADFRVLRSLAMPSILVEVGAMTSADDTELLASSPGRKKIAGCLAEGIFAFLAQLE